MRNVNFTPTSKVLFSLARFWISHPCLSQFNVNNKSRNETKIYVAQFSSVRMSAGTRSNKNFENTRECVWLFMTKRKRDNFHCYWKFNVLEVCRSTHQTTLAESQSTKKLSGEEWMNFFVLFFSDTILRSCRRQRRLVSRAWKEYLQTFPIYFDFHSIYYVTSFGFFSLLFEKKEKL